MIAGLPLNLRSPVLFLASLALSPAPPLLLSTRGETRSILRLVATYVLSEQLARLAHPSLSPSSTCRRLKLACISSPVQGNYQKYKVPWGTLLECSVRGLSPPPSPHTHTDTHHTLYFKGYGYAGKVACLMVTYAVLSSFFNNGPLQHVWCMRIEAKHKYFKTLAGVINNFINIPKSLAFLQQLQMCYFQLSDIFVIKEPDFGSSKFKSMLFLQFLCTSLVSLLYLPFNLTSLNLKNS